MSTYTATSGKHRATIQVGENDRVTVDGRELEAILQQAGGTSTLRVGSKQYNVYIQRIHDLHYEIWINHDVIPVTLETPLSQLLTKFARSGAKKSSEYSIRAPMPGLIKEIHVAAGDTVHPGTGLVVLEAMKMENEIRSSVHGTIKSIEVRKQDAVEKSQLLIEIEPQANE
jgi:biotin carboxyl carrier protein